MKAKAAKGKVKVPPLAVPAPVAAIASAPVMMEAERGGEPPPEAAPPLLPLLPLHMLPIHRALPIAPRITQLPAPRRVTSTRSLVHIVARRDSMDLQALLVSEGG